MLKIVVGVAPKIVEELDSFYEAVEFGSLNLIFINRVGKRKNSPN